MFSFLDWLISPCLTLSCWPYLDSLSAPPLSLSLSLSLSVCTRDNRGSPLSLIKRERKHGTVAERGSRRKHTTHSPKMNDLWSIIIVLVVTIITTTTMILNRSSIIRSCNRIRSSNKICTKSSLPLGTLAWPLVGETIDFISCAYSDRPESFMDNRRSL